MKLNPKELTKNTIIEESCIISTISKISCRCKRYVLKRRRRQRIESFSRNFTKSKFLHKSSSHLQKKCQKSSNLAKPENAYLKSVEIVLQLTVLILMLVQSSIAFFLFLTATFKRIVSAASLCMPRIM